ncbi:MAG: hypothetical protein AABZ23_02065 [Deltaproteobacteria bacterium]
MADSIRQKILDAVDLRLKTITKANGYETDIGSHVFHWKASDFAHHDLPLVEYRDAACSVMEGGPVGFHTFGLTVDIELLTMAGASTPAEVRKAVADIHKAAGQDMQWGGLALNTEPLGDEMKIAQADKVIGGALIRIKILYRTRVFDPYNQ